MTELKPFTVGGQEISGELLETMQKNGLSQSCVKARILYQKWTVEDAVSIPIGSKRQKRDKKERVPLKSINSPVKTYFLSEQELEELWERCGKPGQLIKSYAQKKPPISLSGTWDA